MYISVDVGGTNTRIGLLDMSKGEKIVDSLTFKVAQEFSSGIQKIIEGIEYLSRGQKIKGIGACFPGMLDEHDYIITANNLRDWENRPIKKILEERFTVPVRMAHDVVAAAIGEALFGIGKTCNHFVYIIWGTGIGGASLTRVGKSYHVTSFENGHHSINWQGKMCSCGQRGCPEAYLGGEALEEIFGGNLTSVSDDDLRWQEVAEYASQTVMNTIMFHPTSYIVFSGGVITNRKFLLGNIKKILIERLKVFETPQLTLAEKGDDSALYGGAGLFLIELLK